MRDDASARLATTCQRRGDELEMHRIMTAAGGFQAGAAETGFEERPR